MKRSWIGGFLLPPTFEGDEDKTRVAKLLNATLLALLVAAVAFGIATVILQPSQKADLLSAGLAVVWLVFVRYLMHRGRVRLASMVLLLLTWLSINFIVFIDGAVHSPGVAVAYVLSVVMANLLLGGYAAIGFGGVSILTVMGLVWAENRGILAPQMHADALVFGWVALAVEIAVIAVLMYLASQGTEDVLERARRSEARYRELVETMGDGLAVQDGTGVITYVNDRVCEMFGYSRDELIGRSLLEFVDEPNRSTFTERFDEPHKAERSPYEIAFTRKDGQPVSTLVSPQAILDADGNPAGSFGVITDVTERKQAGKELAEFKTLTDHANYGIAMSDLEGNLTYINQYFAEVHGYEPDELIGKNLAVFHNKDQLPRVLELARQLQDTGNYSAEKVWHSRRDGSAFPMLMNGTLIEDPDGKPLFMAATAIDITENEQREQRLQLLSQAVEQTSEGIAVSDLEGNVLWVNPAFAEMHGYPPEELVGEHLSVFHTPDQLPSVEADTRRIKEIGESHGEIWHARRDGTAFPTWMNNSLLRDEDGRPSGMIATIRDISEAKLAEAELRRSRDALAQAERLAHLGSWEWDIQDNSSICSDEWYRLLGLEPQQIAPSYEEFLSYLHPDDRAAMRQVTEAALLNGKPFRIQYRIVRPDGSQRIIDSEGEVAFDGDGRPLQMTGMMLDVTERAQAEAQLRVSEKRLRSLVENVPDVIMTVDRGGTIAFINRTAPGLTVEDVTGTDSFEYLAPEYHDRYRQALARALRDGAIDRFQHVAGGMWWESRVAPLGAQTEANGVLVIATDITERKQAEEVLQRRDAIMEAVSRAAGRFLRRASWELSIERILMELGVATEADRAYVYRNHVDDDGVLLVSEAYEWAAPGIETQVTNPEHQNVRWLGSGYERWLEMLSQGESVTGHVREYPESERQQMARYGVRSVLVVPIFVEEEWWGHIGFDMCRTERSWAATEVEALRAAAGILGSAIQREQVESELQRHRDHLEELVQARTAELVTANEYLEQEIARRQRAEEEIRNSEVRLKQLLSVNPAVIYAADVDGDRFTVTFASENVQKQLGYDPRIIVGDPTFWLEHAHPDDVSRALPELASLFERDEIVVEYRFRHVDGSYRWLHDEMRLIRDVDGCPLEVVGAWFDVSDRVKAEKMLAQQAEELVRSNIELEQFAYVASHDLREPLRKIRSYVELLERRYRGQLDPRADKYLDYVVDGCDRMQALIADLLTYSRAGRGELALTETDLGMVLEQVLSDLEVAIRESRAVITHDPLPSVVADPEQMAQVLRNLVENALKFCGLEIPSVHVSALRKGDEWVLSVRDNGIGIDPQFAERIFQIFQRLHTRSEYPGTGVGLAISKKIVERHGGRIWVESQPGEGSTFCFSVPAR